MKTTMFFAFFLTMLLGMNAFAQDYRILVQPAGVKEWGYSDLTGQLVIDAKFKKAIGFSDGYAAIYDSKLKQFYFIDKDGNTLQTEIKDFKLIEIFGFGMKGFIGGFAAVKILESWGFFDTSGKLVIPAKYDNVTTFNQGFATAKLGSKFFVLDKNAGEYPVDVPGIADLNEFSEGFASYKTDEGKVGFVDGSGKVVIEAAFKSAGDFHVGLAWAKNDAGMVGYINTSGEWVIDPGFDSGKDFDALTGLARVKSGDKWGYVNKSGGMSYINDSEIFEDFFNGLARGKKGGLFGFYNDKMEWAIQPQYDGARDFKNGYAAVRKGELWGVIDVSGKMIIAPKFDDIKDVEVIKH